MPDRQLDALIDAVVDREPVAWDPDREQQDSDDTALGLLRTLHGLAAAAPQAPRGDWEPSRALHPTPIVWFGRIVVGLASLQLVAGLVGLAMGYNAPRSVPTSATLATVLGYGLAAAWLMIGGARDHRARALGGLYLVVAASFALRFLPTGPLVGPLLAGLSVQPFMPFFFWSFAEAFPRTARSGTANRICRWGLWLSMGVGSALLAMKVLATFKVSAVLAAAMERYYARDLDAASSLGPSGVLTWSLLYWAPAVALLVPPSLVILVKRRLAPPAERRRATVFTFGFAVVMFLAAASVLIESIVPSFFTFARVHRSVTTLLFFGGLLMAPFITTYAVLVDDLLDVRTALTRGARYLLARQVLVGLAAIPAVLLIAFLYTHRSETIGQALSESTGLALVGLAMAGAVLTLLRDRALRYLDARFDGTPVDWVSEAAALTTTIGNARIAAEVVNAVVLTVSRCVAVGEVQVYRMSASRTSFTAAAGGWRAITSADALFALINSDRAPVMLDGSESDLRPLLPPGDRAWCQSTGTAMLVPIVGSADHALGAIAVGAKANGDPFLRAERTFVGIIASAVALKFEGMEPAAEASEQKAHEEPALVCAACGQARAAASDSARGSCDCGGRWSAASVPAVLAGKFTTTAYVGAGAMGIVYRAVDTTLHRTVALKALSRLSGPAAERLASEARMMAAVAHPNLATIYGVERWRRTPILVLEYLERGSLASRLHRPMAIDEVLRLGVLLAPALGQLHDAHILHRDIKPTNIGFTRDDAPKLLDFGLASFLTAEASDAPARLQRDHSGPSETSRTQAVRLGQVALAGTPLYLPPEAVEGASPSPAFDLWALALVLFEAMAGRHPFAADTVAEVLDKVRRTGPLDLARFRPGCPPAVADTFRRLLAPAPEDRCGTAAELHEALQQLL